MAKPKPVLISEPVPLSLLARWMVSAYGIGRLRPMRAEYQAGLPHDMNPRTRQDRIEAINEIFHPEHYHRYQVDPAQFIKP